MSDIAFLLITPIIVCFFIGYKMDEHYSPNYPTFTVIFSVLGIITGFWSVYKKYIK